jgi:hypothetical protein
MISVILCFVAKASQVPSGPFILIIQRKENKLSVHSFFLGVQMTKNLANLRRVNNVLSSWEMFSNQNLWIPSSKFRTQEHVLLWDHEVHNETVFQIFFEEKHWSYQWVNETMNFQSKEGQETLNWECTLFGQQYLLSDQEELWVLSNFLWKLLHVLMSRHNY